MRKLLISLVLCGTLVGCGGMSDDWILVESNGIQKLSYYKYTGIIYIKQGYRMSPYISENGKYCRYVNGKIEEVE